jgi:nickel/cobalt transporter (NiCoT) family protein
LPLLFAAGMTLLDTADSVLMSHAYSWASPHPARTIFCNLTVTGLSVAVALIIGTIELLQLLGRALGPNAGYGVTALFICTWVGSVLVWKHARLARRWSSVAD